MRIFSLFCAFIRLFIRSIRLNKYSFCLFIRLFFLKNIHFVCSFYYSFDCSVMLLSIIYMTRWFFHYWFMDSMIYGFSDSFMYLFNVSFFVFIIFSPSVLSFIWVFFISFRSSLWPFVYLINQFCDSFICILSNVFLSPFIHQIFILPVCVYSWNTILVKKKSILEIVLMIRASWCCRTVT